MNVYVSGPFFNTEERKRMEVLREFLIKKYRKNIYLPIDLCIPDAELLPEPIWAKRVYNADMEALDHADLMIVVYDGHYSDSGTAFEIGYAIAKGIDVHILVVNPEETQSLMITNCTPFIYSFNDYVTDVLRLLSLSELSQT